MSEHQRVITWAVGSSLLGAAVLAASCTGPAGEPGPAGTPGASGTACWDLDQSGECEPAEDIDGDGSCSAADCRAQGEAGSGGGGGSGTSSSGQGGEQLGLQYVGSDVCALCHQEQHEQHAKSGHFSALTRVEGGQAPSRPFDSNTGGVPDPPLGLTWDDVSYVIGGFGWKAGYVASDGYLLTGESTQYNFANPQVGTAAGWAAYHAGEQKPFDCGSCHTTGWIPCDAGSASCDHQDGLAGMAGSFAESGVQCEACHGPASQHVANPYLVQPEIDRSAEACGKCHRRGDVERVDFEDGFLRHQGQYDEMFSSKKHAMRCIDCHNPHQSAKFADPAVNPDKSIRIDCVSCHTGYDTNQKSLNNTFFMQVMLKCTDCHMPPMVKSAAGDLAKHTGDVHAHLFAINPDYSAPQSFTDTDGEDYSSPYITLDYACNRCHGVIASSKTVAELEAIADGYHQ